MGIFGDRHLQGTFFPRPTSGENGSSCPFSCLPQPLLSSVGTSVSAQFRRRQSDSNGLWHADANGDVDTEANVVSSQTNGSCRQANDDSAERGQGLEPGHVVEAAAAGNAQSRKPRRCAPASQEAEFLPADAAVRFTGIDECFLPVYQSIEYLKEEFITKESHSITRYYR